MFGLDNLCQKALDLSNGKLIVANNWAIGTFCHWLISAGDENSYTTLEFQKLNVSYEIPMLFIKVVLYQNI